MVFVWADSKERPAPVSATSTPCDSGQVMFLTCIFWIIIIFCLPASTASSLWQRPSLPWCKSCTQGMKQSLLISSQAGIWQNKYNSSFFQTHVEYKVQIAKLQKTVSMGKFKPYQIRYFPAPDPEPFLKTWTLQTKLFLASKPLANLFSFCFSFVCLCASGFWQHLWVRMPKSSIQIACFAKWKGGNAQNHARQSFLMSILFSWTL